MSNLNLYKLGKKKLFGESMIATKFEPHDNWLPPCYLVPRELERALVEAGLPAGVWGEAEVNQSMKLYKHKFFLTYIGVYYNLKQIFCSFLLLRYNCTLLVKKHIFLSMSWRTSLWTSFLTFIFGFSVKKIHVGLILFFNKDILSMKNKLFSSLCRR